MPTFSHLRFSVFISFFSLFCSSLASDGSIPDEAKNLLKAKDYTKALSILLNVAKENKNDLETMNGIGVCYLNIHGDKSKAIPYLEKASSLKKNNWPVLADLAMAYQYGKKYAEAIAIYENIEKNGDPKYQGMFLQEIEYCKRAELAVKNPVNVSFTNLGKNINSEYADYFPIVPEYGNLLAFTSRRKGNTGNITDKDGFFTSDIYLADFKNGQFSKAKNAGAKTNTPGDEQVTGCTPDGKTLMVYIDYGGKNFGDLFFCDNGKNNSTGELKNIGENLNTPFFETAGTLNSDGTAVYFASDLPGGYGGRDLYKAIKLPDGNWLEPQNLGPVINTPFNEDFPWISDDGMLLTFSSEGHQSIGGFDLYKATWDTVAKTWKEPENFGYPINTSDDEYNICLSSNRETGYMSCWRPDSEGDWDIYKITFNDLVQPKTTFVYTTIIAGDSIKPNVSGSCLVTDKINGDTLGIYNPKRNGKFLMILPTGLYDVQVSSPGFEDYKEELYLSDKELYSEKLNKVIRLSKKKK
ncbi:MAG: hypothetical protein ACK5JC_11355 [Bacteroidota bacterium]|jgi:hypothetical protein